MYYQQDDLISNEEDEMTPFMWQIAVRQYHQAWDQYIEAGCPFGETDEAMLLWFTFDLKTAEN